MLYRILVVLMISSIFCFNVKGDVASKEVPEEHFRQIEPAKIKFGSNKKLYTDCQETRFTKKKINSYSNYVPNGSIVEVALSQLGNEGGEKFWSWYGFNSHAAWCACFASWCADQCGYIDAGIIPKFSLCQDGANWFKERGEWLDRSATPSPGMFIFFDYSGSASEANHVGIVEKVEGNNLYVIDGNSHDMVRENVYEIGQYDIMGYGTPCY